MRFYYSKQKFNWKKPEKTIRAFKFSNFIEIPNERLSRVYNDSLPIAFPFRLFLQPIVLSMVEFTTTKSTFWLCTFVMVM